MLLHYDLGPFFDFTLLLPFNWVLDDFLAASLEDFLLEDSSFVCFSIVPPIIKLVVTGFHHWDHTAPA